MYTIYSIKIWTQPAKKRLKKYISKADPIPNKKELDKHYFPFFVLKCVPSLLIKLLCFKVQIKTQLKYLSSHSDELQVLHLLLEKR